MSIFRRKNKDNEAQEEMLEQIARGGSPIVAPPAAPPAPVPPAGSASFSALGMDMSAILAKSIQAIGEHADQLRARGLDPTQLQRALEAQVHGGQTTAGNAFVVASGTQIHGGDLVATLQSLSQLHASGSLSDEEFAEAKAKLLSGG